jgi:2-dehydro-3-deoxyphosphogluconate aldolase/(4S)-4-hydroxy-2-oxoglutarate aldolase
VTVDLRGELARRQIIAVVRARSAERAVAAGRALAAGGVTLLEVTFTVPDAAAAIGRLAEDRELVVGAGTVLTAGQARDAVDAGARFLVSPHLDPELLDAAAQLGVPALPGVFTATEVAAASRRCSVMKLFPAALGGPALLRALRGPFPELAVVPTGGVELGNLAEWFDAGAIAVGAGADLCPPAAVERGDLATLRERAQAYVEALAGTKR